MYDPRIFWDPIILHDVKDDLDLVLKYPRRQNSGLGGGNGMKGKNPKSFPKIFYPHYSFSQQCQRKNI